MPFKTICQNIRLILSDVDGVMTDGTALVADDGMQQMRFHIRDGLGIKLWQRAGFEFGIVTGRKVEAVCKRAETIGIKIIHQGVSNKLATVQEIATSLNLKPDEICFIGDDLIDLAAIEWCGFGVAVADAVIELRSAAKFITTLQGGQGAVREVIELILKQSGKWPEVMQAYT